MTAREIHLEERYVPHEKQRQAHTAKERYVLCGGVMGGGKSVFLVNEAIQLYLDHPGNVGLLCRWELDSLRRTTLMTLEEYLPEELVRRHHKTEKYYELINGSIIFYGGLKPSSEAIGAQRLKSMQLGWFAIDEATEVPKKYFDLLKTRLRHTVNGKPVRYKGLLASNPEPGWVREVFIDRKLPDQVFIPALPVDNPHLPEDYVESLRENLPEELVKKYLDGDWDVMEGENYEVTPEAWEKVLNDKIYLMALKKKVEAFAKKYDLHTLKYAWRQGLGASVLMNLIILGAMVY